MVLAAETNMIMKEFTGIWIVVVIATNFGVNLLIQLHGFVCNIKNNWRKIWTHIKCKKKIIEPNEIAPPVVEEASMTPVKVKEEPLSQFKKPRPKKA